MSGFLRHISLWALAAAFSWKTVVLAAGPLHAVRLALPSWAYWIFSAAIASVMWGAGIPIAACAFFAVAIVVGLYTDIQSWHLSRGAAAWGSIIALVAAVGTGFGAWCRMLKISPVTWLSQWVEPMVTKAKSVYPNLEIEVDMIIYQLPSALVVLGLIALAIAVVSERTWLRALGLNARAPSRWTDFKLWDAAIYVLMLALLAALTRHGVKPITIVGANVLNVLVVLYFFQGMAVIFKAFELFKVGVIWRLLIGMVLTLQLALIVAVLGVADYWFEFRNRLTRRPVGPKTEL